MANVFVLLGGFNMFLAVALGAFGAHGLKKVLAVDLMVVYQTGVQYHFYHALGLLFIGVLSQQWPPSMLTKSAGWLLFAGIILFSGSLYVLSISGIRQLGMITPFGGVAFLVGWILLSIAAYQQMMQT